MRCHESLKPALIRGCSAYVVASVWLTCPSPPPSLLLFFFQVAQTADGLDADLWKDGLFKSKVTRFLCFTRTFSKENVSGL